MDRIAGRSWKEYYSSERDHRRHEICEMIKRAWNAPDPQVEAVFRSGGALSIPHTILDSSMDPLVRTVRALYKTGKKRLVSIGLIHFQDKRNEEFCLDGLRYVLDLTRDELGLPDLPMEVIYIERDPKIDPYDLPSLVKNAEDQTKAIENSIGYETAIVITGDLVHYGYGYKMSDVVEDPAPLIDGMIERSLELLYKKRDPIAYLQYSRDVKSDQMYIGIALGALLKGDLGYRIFSTTLADYSEILEAKKPTVVASVFYGVYPN